MKLKNIYMYIRTSLGFCSPAEFQGGWFHRQHYRDTFTFSTGTIFTGTRTLPPPPPPPPPPPMPPASLLPIIRSNAYPPCPPPTCPAAGHPARPGREALV